MTDAEKVQTIRGLLKAEQAKYEHSMWERDGVNAYRHFVRAVSDVVKVARKPDQASL